ncbi:MAG: serine/threonine-protein kinase [Kofleriaceae bacterium]|nr:serine/threonine-protein kinase [Kofleriaceae bacterium]
MGSDPSADDTVQATDATNPGRASQLDIDIENLPTGNVRYQPGELLGKGGMGDVLLAQDRQIHRDVAIKRMRSRQVGSVDRFLREARIQGRLDHPAIVPIHEVSVDESGRPYFVMKRLTGTTLADILANRGHVSLDTSSVDKHPLSRLLRAFTDVCLAVDFAHSRNVIHRDLKPSNIMLGDFGEVYVLDWGVARELDSDGHDSLEVPPAPGASKPGATEAGAVLGTIGYMPPEQQRGLPVDRRADVYALGCILFEILAGSPLHRAGDFTAVFEEYDARPSVRAPTRDVPPELDALVVRATHPDPTKRPVTARELCERVQRYLDGDRDVALRRKLAREQIVLARAALRGDMKTDATVSDILRKSPSEDDRRKIMQYAGRAIALDPTNVEAADLVGRVMLEPPPATPREVEAELDAFDDHNLRDQSKVAFVAFLLYLAFIPLMLWVGIDSPAYLTSIAAACLINSASAYYFVTAKKPVPSPVLWFVAVANMVLVALLARLFSPMLIAPGLAAGTMLGFSFHPRFGRTLVLAAGLSAAILLPWLGEWLGLWSRTILDVDGMMAITSPAGTINARRFELAHVFYVLCVVFTCGILTQRMAFIQRETRRTAHLHAWHLRQLVPLAPPTPSPRTPS